MSRELQAGTDSSVITASTDGRMESLPKGHNVKEDSYNGLSIQLTIPYEVRRLFPCD